MHLFCLKLQHRCCQLHHARIHTHTHSHTLTHTHSHSLTHTHSFTHSLCAHCLIPPTIAPQAVELASQHADPKVAANTIVKEARRKWTQEGGGYIDDVTAVVIRLQPHPRANGSSSSSSSGGGGGVRSQTPRNGTTSLLTSTSPSPPDRRAASSGRRHNGTRRARQFGFT